MGKYRKITQLKLWLRTVEELRILNSHRFSNYNIYWSCCIYLNEMHINWALKTLAILFEQNEVLFHLFNNCPQQMLGFEN